MAIDPNETHLDDVARCCCWGNCCGIKKHSPGTAASSSAAKRGTRTDRGIVAVGMSEDLWKMTLGVRLARGRLKGRSIAPCVDGADEKRVIWMKMVRWECVAWNQNRNK